MLSLIVLLQFGGAETPSHLISSTLWELFEHPEALAAAKADPSRTADAVEETLRHVSPVHFIFQTATQDIEMRGETIPSGSGVFAFIGSANRDERAFDEPDRFDVDRRSKTKHLSFAQGAHFCIGAPLGRLMCTAGVAAALERWPDLHPLERKVEWLPSFWVRGLKQYMVAP